VSTPANLIGTNWPRKILHIDLDAFYASVEALDNPDLIGQPIIVGGLGRRGVVATASYEARKNGVHSAMPMERARRSCPNAVFLRPRFGRYRELSEQVFSIYEAWTKRVEKPSLDEAYLDVTAHISSPVDIAKSIRASIHRKTGLTGSAGVSTNKFLAKLASDIDKPNGLTVIRPEEAQDFLAPLPVERLWGVGPANAERLRTNGFKQIGELAASSLEDLQRLFGERWGRQLWEFAHGRDRRRVEPPSRPKSISSETTYEHDQPSWEAVWPNIKQFVVDMERGLERWSLSARTVTLKVRFQDFTTITRSHTPMVPVRQADEIMRVARKLVDRVPLDGRRIRLVGLGGSNLIRPGEQTSCPDDGSPRQLGLFAPSANIPSEDSST
jgi:DNA polymerase-4|tara:strand:- start:7398 stop:8549 length:1152 start_codon:yes stop_codon:yes gene_type:complete